MRILQGLFGAGAWIGSELITEAGDRTFAAGQGNWSVESGAEVSWDNTDMDFACTGANAVRLAVTLTEGTVYRLGFNITAFTSGDLNCYIGGSAIAVSGEAVTSFSVDAPAGAGDWIQFASSNFIGSIDNVSVKRVF